MLQCLAVLATAAVGYKFIYPFLRVLFIFTIGKRLFSKRARLRTFGGWAIITGGGDGIGKALAHELAKDGLNIFILGRTEEKLKSVVSSLESTYRVQAKYMAVDFTRTDIYERIEEELSKLPSISCLVNNVGMMNQHWEEFGSEPTLTMNQIQRVLACNVTAVTCMTRLVLPRLLAQKSGSAIINMASVAGQLPLPYAVLYGSTKAYVTQFSDCLEAELSKTHVMVQCYCSMYVKTNLTDTDESFTVPDARTFARSALDMFGVERNTTGYFAHSLQTALFSFSPRFGIINSRHSMYLKKYKKN